MNKNQFFFLCSLFIGHMYAAERDENLEMLRQMHRDMNPPKEEQELSDMDKLMRSQQKRLYSPSSGYGMPQGNVYQQPMSSGFGVYDLVEGTKALNKRQLRKVTLEDQYLGATLGGAIGDALGKGTEKIALPISNGLWKVVPKEQKTMAKIFERYPKGLTQFSQINQTAGWFAPTGYNSQTVVGFYTDDTAMARIVFWSLIDSAEKVKDISKLDLNLTMSKIADRLIADMSVTKGWTQRYRGPGKTSIKNINTLVRRKQEFKSKKGKSNPEWWKAGGPKEGGNGSVMRVYPFALVLKENPDKAIKFAAQHSYLTHGDPSALAACAAMVAGVIANFDKKNPEVVIRKMADAARLYDHATATELEAVIKKADKARNALANEESGKFNTLHEQFFNEYRGWGAREAIVAAAYLYSLFPDDIMGAIYAGVHTPGDSDSIAGMAGTLVGSRVGALAIPGKLKEQLEDVKGLSALA